MLKITAIGNLGKDATANTVNGKNVINFSVASTDKWKDNKGDQMEKTTWLECAYWVDGTKVADFLKKGTQVYIEGNGDIRNWTTPDGKTGSNMTCRVFTLQLLGSPNGTANANANPQHATSETTIDAASVNGTAKAEPKGKLPF